MSEDELKTLDLPNLHERHPGLTQSLAGTYHEAAAVCLNRHHESPIEVSVLFNGKTTARHISFASPDERTQAAWANEIDTTESGAYGVSLAAVESEAELVAVRRAETLTGADWYVAPKGEQPADLENCYRLEVSGVDAGNKATVEARLRQKIDQTRKGSSNLPAIASVVGFKEKSVLIQMVGDQL